MSLTKPLSIGFYCYSTFNRGGDRLVLAYANHLASVGHDVTLHVKEIDTVFDVSPALKVDLVKCKNKAGFLWHAFTNNLGHDLVIVTIIHLHMLLSLHNNVVYYAQADDIEYYNDSLMRNLVDFLYRIHFNTARPMISMSQHLTDIFIRRYSAKKIATINSGIDHGMFYPDIDEELLGLKGEKKAIVLMARGDAYRKGFDISLQVLEYLNSYASSMELWVCGDQLLQNNFTFTTRNFGVVSDKRLRQILSSADMFLYPSRHEGFGLFPLEAMACGIVAITTDAVPYARTTPSMLVADNGDIERLKKIISDLLNDTQRLEYLKRQSLVDAAGYDHEIAKSEFASIVSEITKGGTR